MVLRHIINSAPRFHAGQFSYQQSLMQGNQRALSLLTWYNLPQPAWTCFNHSIGFPLVLPQHQIPGYAHSCQSLNTPYHISYNNERMSLNMEHSSERDPKRRCTPSSSHPYSRSKVPKMREMDTYKQVSRESKKHDLRTSSSQGFTQANWPKNVGDCEWRRGPRNYECRQNQVRNVQIPKRPNHLRGTYNPTQGGSKSISSHIDFKVTVENTAPINSTGSCSQSSMLSAPPLSLPLQSSRYFHSSKESYQASRSGTESKSTYRKRPWFHLPQHRGHQTKVSRRDGVEFSIVSYNVLAQCLLNTNKHLYNHCDKQILLWDHRKRKIMDEILQADADVICLQEVESRHFQDFFKPALETQGFASIYKKRTGDKGDGCATFYKTSCFQEVSHSKLEYQRGIGLLDRDNVAIVVMLQPKGFSSSHQLCVANTHLLWNPRRGDIKLAQLGLLFAEIERLSNTNQESTENTYHPLVLCGDFNSVPHSPLYKFIKEGHVTYQGMAGVDVSGQELGRARVLMRSPLWPKEIGVSSQCRYVDTNFITQSSRNSVHTGGAPRRNRRNSRDHPADYCVLSEDSQGQLIHPFFFSSVYDHCQGNYEITTNHSSTNCTVDYIFYSDSMSSKAGSPDKPLGTPNFTSNLSLVKRLTLFTDGEVKAMGGLPNVHWASDHLSLQATLRLTPKD